MALFTFILEFDGGTYISQVHAASVRGAVTQHASHVVSNKAVAAASVRRRIADGLSAQKPVALDGMRNVWCCSTSVGKKFALLNIVATA